MGCLNCGEKTIHFHCTPDGNNEHYPFCSETCIHEYSHTKGVVVKVIEEFDSRLTKERVVFT